MKKILYLITQSEMGGAQQYLLTLLRELDRGKFHPLVAAAEKPGDLFRVMPYPTTTFMLKHLQRKLHLRKDMLALTELRWLIRHTKPDILHLLSSKAGFLGALAGRLEHVPHIVYRIGGFAFQEDISLPKKALYFLAEWVSGFWKNRIIVNNKADFAVAKKWHLWAKKTRYIPNGIPDNIPFPSREKARASLDIPADIFVIGAIANFYPNKGLLDLLQAVKSLREAPKFPPNFQTIILGDGEQRPLLEKFIAKNKLASHVKLMGKKENASHYLKAFDVLVLPSHKEGMPWVILEAFAAEVPVIATKVGGISSMIEDEKEGLLVKPHRPEDLSAAIQKIAENKSLAHALTKHAMEKWKREFTLKSMIKSTEDCYNTDQTSS